MASCTSSDNQAVRYSAYKGILPYVLYNAKLALSEQEYAELTETIDKRVVKDIEETNIIVNNNDIESISKKMIVINNNINRLNNNMNKNISIDRFIIEMWRCNNESSKY
mgnify:CR=1 FL=1